MSFLGDLIGHTEKLKGPRTDVGKRNFRQKYGERVPLHVDNPQKEYQRLLNKYQAVLQELANEQG